MTPARFPHSDTPGSTLGCQLPRAYRRLLRPSSALDAKASTMCPSQLVTHTTNPTHHQRPAHQPHKKKTPPHPLTGTQRSLTRVNRPPQTMNQTWQCTQHTTKMLASTIQISNNNPTPEPAPHHRMRPARAGSARPQGPGPKPQTPHRTHTRGGSRLILQNPNSVSPTPGLPRRSPHPSTHPHRASTQPTRKRQEEETRMSMIPLVSHHHALAPRHHSTVAEARAQVGVCAP